MSTPYLEDFLIKAGSAVHEINTIIVGLASIENESFIKPEELTIKWESKDPKASARKARQFALKSSLVFIDDALAIYLNGIGGLLEDSILRCILDRKNPIYIEEFEKIVEKENYDLFRLLKKLEQKKLGKENKGKFYKGLDSADRIRCLDKLFKFPNNYWIPIVILLICWRNRIAHESSMAHLLPTEILKLRTSAKEMLANHASIDINLTIEHFNSSTITLKDFTTLIAITIKVVRFVDENLVPNADISYIEEHIKGDSNKKKVYNKIASQTNEEMRKRKFKNFIRTELPQFSNFWEGYYSALKIIE